MCEQFGTAYNTNHHIELARLANETSVIGSTEIANQEYSLDSILTKLDDSKSWKELPSDNTWVYKDNALLNIKKIGTDDTVLNNHYWTNTIPESLFYNDERRDVTLCYFQLTHSGIPITEPQEFAYFEAGRCLLPLPRINYSNGNG